MRYKLLGRSGLRVSELCLGTMTFGEDWGWGANRDECDKMLRLFTDAGGNFIDTANLYTNGTSERLVGELIRANRDHFVLATKYTLNPRPDDPNAGGNHRKNLVQSLEASLKRLQTDFIDLYWVHAWDPLTPIDETMRALDDAVRAGKILYVGISDAPAWIVSQANMLAQLRGWSPFCALQIQYSLIERTPERDLLPMAKSLDLAVTPWGILGSGVLTGKFEKGKETKGHRLSDVNPNSTRALSDRNYTIAAEVKKVAQEIGKTPSQIAVAWLLHQQSRALIVPILGARKAEQLQDNLAALNINLPDQAVARLNAASEIDLGFPHDFLMNAQGYIYGKTRERIDNHRE